MINPLGSEEVLSSDSRPSRSSFYKKQVRFQVYEAKTLTKIQDMRREKEKELDRFSKERLLQDTVRE